MKKITKSIISILILIITVYSLIPAPFAYGATTEMTEKQKEAGAAIAAMAQNLYGAYKDDIVYSCPRRITQKECFDRGEAYKGYSTCGTAYASNESPKGTFERKYAVDCVGFVNMAVCNALNFSINVASTTSVVGPTGTTNGYKKNENITIETAMPGDIVRFPNSHVGICIGNGKMIHCTGSGVEIDNIADVRNSKGLDYVIIYRIMESYCTGNYRTSWIPKGHSPNCPGCSFAGQGDGINQSNTGYSNPEKPTGPIPDDDGSPLEKDINGRDDSNDYIDSFNGTIKEFYYYSGVPNSGTYMGTITFGSWLFDLLSNAADWLIGIMTMGYKIQFIGWASVIQNFATNFVEEVMGLTKDGSAEFIGVGTIKGFGTNPLSVEDILFNRVPILDIDFFNFSTAGGLDIANSRISSNIFNQGTTAIGFTEGDTITPMLAIRQTIANMYVSLRYASIIIMLAVLVYVGLRMALSSVAQEKALYKKQLISWIVGFIVMMFIHYFMIAVLSLNTTVISWFSTNDTLTALYDTVRAYAYEIPASKGWGGTIVYVFLVYYLIKLLFFYFKRFFAVIVLTVMAPILGIAYAVEKMKGKNKSLKSWMKEYTYNVIIQTVHIIIYLVFMGIIVALIESASGFDLLGYGIIIIIMLQFMIGADDIIKNIFGIKSGTMNGMLQTAIEVGISFGLVAGVAQFINPVQKFRNGINNRTDNSIENSYAGRGYNGSNSYMARQAEFATAMKNLQKKQVRDFNATAIGDGRGTGGIFVDTKDMAVGTLESFPMIFEGEAGKGFANMALANNGFEGAMAISDPNLPPLKMEEEENVQNRNSLGQQGATVNEDADYKLNLAKKGKDTKLGKVVLHLATAGVSTKVANIIESKNYSTDIIEEQQERTRRSYTYLEQMEEIMDKIDEEIEDHKSTRKTRAFYVPGQDETENQKKINKKLKEADRNDLQVALRQSLIKPDFKIDDVREALKGVKQEDILTQSELEKITEKVLRQQGYEVGEKLGQNIQAEAIDKLFKNLEAQGVRPKSIRLNSNLQERIDKIAKMHGREKNDAIKDFKQNVTEGETSEIVKTLESHEVVDLIKNASNKEGTAKKKEVPNVYKKIVENAKKLQELNEKMYELGNSKAPSAEDLVQTILHKDKEDTSKQAKANERKVR